MMISQHTEKWLSAAFGICAGKSEGHVVSDKNRALLEELQKACLTELMNVASGAKGSSPHQIDLSSEEAAEIVAETVKKTSESRDVELFVQDAVVKGFQSTSAGYAVEVDGTVEKMAPA